MKHVWYVAYGSNLSRERFRRYIRGGRPDGSERDLPGCRDTSDPMDSFGVLIRGGVYFAGHSSGWRAGMAFYDPGAHGEVAGRAYLITAEQFVDVLAQEARQAPGITLDMTPTFRGDRFSKGVGGYSILVRVGERGGVPLVTFTRDRRTAPSLAPPSSGLLGGDGDWAARGARMVTDADRPLPVSAARRGPGIADRGSWSRLRPVSATDPDPTWTALITAPYPEWPSGHNCLDAAHVTVLRMFFGDDPSVGLSRSRAPS